MMRNKKPPKPRQRLRGLHPRGIRKECSFPESFIIRPSLKKRKAEMTCARCQHTTVKKFGTYGKRKVQRYRCHNCSATFSEERLKPLGNHYIDFDKAVQVLSLLVEGMSIRAASRLTGMHKRTILSLLVLAGRKCQAVLDARVHNIRPKFVQLDELWTFVHTKEGHLSEDDPAEWGDAYTWIALDAESKLIISHLSRKARCGKRQRLYRRLQFSSEWDFTKLLPMVSDPTLTPWRRTSGQT